jgi:broad specificity phosphatase PhoE
MSNEGFQLPSPMARRLQHPQLPAELLDLTEDEYAAKLREWGYGEHAIEQELVRWREYVDKMVPKRTVPDVEDGPTKGRLFDSWVQARRRRRQQKGDGGDGETEE